jgi:glycosyltransferase involved in cell wall biosynthesis
LRILFIADGRSPIAQGWISHFIDDGYEAHLISTFRCDPPPGLASHHVISTAFSAARKSTSQAGQAPGGARGIRARSILRHWLGPLTIAGAARRGNEILDEVGPDVVHALRIPYEGMLAASMEISMPLLVSVWGNDFTLHASTSPGMKSLTRKAVMRADGLITDCHRDFRFALEWGYPQDQPHTVLPGGGGVDRNLFKPDLDTRDGIGDELQEVLDSIRPGQPVIINPRGFRAYVRNDTFFHSIPRVLEKYPAAMFLCPGMKGEWLAEDWVNKLGIRERVWLLPRLSRAGMSAANRSAWVCVSPAEHDGTPNTFLEALACGSFPVVGDIESLREWVTDGENGFLVDPGDARSLADAVCQALGDETLRELAFQRNQRLIDTRASYPFVRFEGRRFVESVLQSAKR